MAVSPAQPDENLAATIVSEVFGTAARIVRFPMGNRHFVFDVALADGRSAVVRISQCEDTEVVKDALYWSSLLRPLGVPLPAVLHADTSMDHHPFPFVVLDRLQGQDLFFVVDRLSQDDLRELVRRLVAIQRAVGELPAGRGYGFSPRLEGPFPQAHWQQTVVASMERARKRIRAVGVISERWADKVEAAAEGLTGYFANVPSTPFLHDITTKNVIVNGSYLSGIVDVDELCFGDPLFLVGLIRIALLAPRLPDDYADLWLDALRPDDEQKEAHDFYSALFCLDFMGELGHQFNRTNAEPVDTAFAKRLQELLASFLHN